MGNHPNKINKFFSFQNSIFMRNVLLLYITLSLLVYTHYSSAQIKLTATYPATPYQVSKSLFGVHTVNTFFDYYPTESNFKSGASSLHFESWYYPGGSISRLYHYKYNSSFPDSAHGYTVTVAEEQDLEACTCWRKDPATCNPSNCSGTTKCDKYTDDWCNNATSGSFFDKHQALFDYTDDGNSDGKSDASVTLSENIWFDDTTSNFSNLDAMLHRLSDNSTPVDALILGTELQGDDSTNTWFCNVCNYTSPCSSANKLECYKQRATKVMNWLKGSSHYVYNFRSGHIPVVFNAAPGTPYGKTWDNYLYSNSGTRFPIAGTNTKVPGAVNWWWSPGGTLNTASVALDSFKAYFNTQLPNLVTFYNGYFDSMYVAQWGIKTGTYDFANTLLNQMYCLKRMFFMIKNNDNASGSALKFISASFFNIGGANEYDPLFDSGSGDLSSTTTTYDAILELNKIKTEDYGSTTTQNNGQNVSDVESYTFKNHNNSNDWIIFTINYSGSQKNIDTITGIAGSNVYFKTISASDVLQKKSNITISTAANRTRNTSNGDLSSAITLPEYSITLFRPSNNFPKQADVEEANNTNAFSINLFPNPANNLISVQSLGSPITAYRILNNFGQEKLSKKFDNGYNSGSINLDVSSFAPGIYFIQCWSDGRMIVKMFTVIK